LENGLSGEQSFMERAYNGERISPEDLLRDAQVAATVEPILRACNSEADRPACLAIVLEQFGEWLREEERKAPSKRRGVNADLSSRQHALVLWNFINLESATARRVIVRRDAATEIGADYPLSHQRVRRNYDRFRRYFVAELSAFVQAQEGRAPVAPAAPSAEPASLPQNEATAVRSRHRGLVWLASLAVVVIGAVVLSGVVWRSLAAGTPEGGAEHGSDAEIVVEAVPASDDFDWGVATFWVPSATVLEGIPGGILDCTNPAVQDWLVNIGQVQSPIYLTIRNRSQTELLGVSDVTARGTTSPSTKGFFITCESGGIGGGDGELKWSDLKVQADDGAVAVFVDRKPNYFWRGVGPSGVAGLAVALVGDLDFVGHLSVEVVKGASDPITVDVVDPETGEVLELTHHGIPRTQTVVLSPSQEGASLHCVWGGSVSEDCTVDQAQSLIDAAWRG